VTGARGLFGAYVTTGDHRGGQERNERTLRIEAGQAMRQRVVWNVSLYRSQNLGGQAQT
jgi:hypothetical protein